MGANIEFFLIRNNLNFEIRKNGFHHSVGLWEMIPSEQRFSLLNDHAGSIRRPLC